MGMRVRFSVFGRERLHRMGGYRYNAVLVTGLDDQPLHSHNIVIDEGMIRKRADKTELSTNNNNRNHTITATTNIDKSGNNTNITQNSVNDIHGANSDGIFVEDEEDDYFNDEDSSSSDIDNGNSYYKLHSRTLNTSNSFSNNNNNHTSIEQRQVNEINAKLGTSQREGQKSGNGRLLYKNSNSQYKRQRNQDEMLLLFDEDDYAMI